MKMLKALILSLVFCLPISAYAGVWVEDRVSAIAQWGFWSVLFAALFGGFCSIFIKTPMDSRLVIDPRTAKICLGIGAGVFPCISLNAWLGLSPAILTGPAFVLGCLGAPILVILLSWAADPETTEKANRKLDKLSKLQDDE